MSDEGDSAFYQVPNILMMMMIARYCVIFLSTKLVFHGFITLLSSKVPIFFSKDHL